VTGLEGNTTTRPLAGSPSRYRDGARLIAPIAIAAAAFGASFGILARAGDFDPLAAIVMSATTFAGSAQFAVVSTLDTGGAVAAAIVAAILLNGRYAPISVSVAPFFGGSLVRRLLESQLIVDESWVISRRGDGTFDRRILVGAGLVLYVVWTGSTAVGAFVGEAIADPADLGLDAAFPALFLALLVPQLGSRLALATAALAAAVALALIPFTPAGVPIIAASAVCLLGWTRA
jgi:predicted branched-subunit amino acid permease